MNSGNIIVIKTVIRDVVSAVIIIVRTVVIRPPSLYLPPFCGWAGAVPFKESPFQHKAEAC